jgi:hypothetical protein
VPPLPTVERPLTPAERALLEAQIVDVRQRRRALLPKIGLVSAGVCGALAVATLFASGAPATIVILFWTAMALLFTFWIAGPELRRERQRETVLAEALRTSRGRATRIASSRMVSFEEIEDEGACYAFAIDDDTVVFIAGQQFYETDRFPNDDFELVDVLASNGAPLDELLMTHGRPLRPERVIASSIKQQLEIPQHLETANATLETIEARLRP